MSNKKNSYLLIPGPEGWEIWASEAGNVFSQSLDDGPLLVSEIEDIPSANLVMGFPVREALAVPFKVPTNDEAMFDDLASMHLEKLWGSPIVNLRRTYCRRRRNEDVPTLLADSIVARLLKWWCVKH